MDLPAPEGPAPDAIERARRLVDYRGIDLAQRRIVLAVPEVVTTGARFLVYTDCRLTRS